AAHRGAGSRRRAARGPARRRAGPREAGDRRAGGDAGYRARARRRPRRGAPARRRRPAARAASGAGGVRFTGPDERSGGHPPVVRSDCGGRAGSPAARASPAAAAGHAGRGLRHDCRAHAGRVPGEAVRPLRAARAAGALIFSPGGPPPSLHQVSSINVQHKGPEMSTSSRIAIGNAGLKGVSLATIAGSPSASADITAHAVTGSFSTGILTVFGDSLSNTINISRDAAGKLLVNGGAVSVLGGTATVANTSLIQVFGQAGDDVITLNEANGAL